MIKVNNLAWSLACAGLVALGCTGRAARVRDSTAGAMAGVRDTGLRPLGWFANAGQLLFTRIDRVTSGDVGRLLCDSSGFYVLEQERIRPLKVGPSVCALVSHLDNASLERDGRSLVYADVFEQGRIFRVDLKQLSK